MAKKVLIISSSPRKDGNSETLCNRFMDGAAAAGNECEMVILRDLKIAPCIACDYCKKFPGKCAVKDDAPAVLEKMLAADVIVLATPVYFFTVCAQLKTMIDRTRPSYPFMKNKEFYFIATVGTEGKHLVERTFDSLRGFLACLENPIEKGLIYGDNAWLPTDALNLPAYNRAYEMGMNV